MIEIWQQQEGESNRIYSAFTCYLKCRNMEKVAKTLNKSENYVRNLAARQNWKARAAEFDASILEETRQELKKELAQNLKNQWKDCTELQGAAIEALRAKDLSKAGFRSLNEIYHSAAVLQLKLLETFKILDEGNDSKNLTINIIPRNKPVNSN